ncbi:putative single strand-annealing protein [Pelagibacter phage HTVC024P]|nr:putative single strand-annealing protein [Pelagibacter phage HTVC024P]
MGNKNMSSETNVYQINKKNMKNIYEKLYNACNHASGVKKASKVKGMPFNPLLHDDVQRVAMAALLENRLYATCNYVTDVTPKCVIVTCTMKITDIDDPKNFIIVDGCTAMGGLDKYGTGQAMSYSRKYAFLNALNLKTGMDLEDGYNAKPFEEDSVEQSKEEPTYLDDEVNVEDIIKDISDTTTARQLSSVKDLVRDEVMYLKKNNPKAFEQVAKFTREHEVKLNNNQQ